MRISKQSNKKCKCGGIIKNYIKRNWNIMSSIERSPL